MSLLVFLTTESSSFQLGNIKCACVQRPEKDIWCLLLLPTYEAGSLPEPGVCGIFLLFFQLNWNFTRKPPLILSLLLPEMGSQVCAGYAAYVVLSPSSGSPDCTASSVNHSAILWQSPNLATYTGNTIVTYSTLWWCSGALSCPADLSPSNSHDAHSSSPEIYTAAHNSSALVPRCTYCSAFTIIS